MLFRSTLSAQDQWRNEQTYAVAQELAAWLGNVQRAAMRGMRCDLTIAPNANPVSNGQEMARASQTAGTSFPTSCLTYSSLMLESVPSPSQFTITPRLLTLTFTPRGTIANTSTDPVVISIANLAGGPVRCVRLDGLMGALRVGYLVGSTCQA